MLYLELTLTNVSSDTCQVNIASLILYQILLLLTNDLML